MTERAAPFYCPYCGDEDLRPSEEGHGAWECRACNRAFQLKFLGLLAQGFRGTATGAASPGATGPAATGPVTAGASATGSGAGTPAARGESAHPPHGSPHGGAS